MKPYTDIEQSKKLAQILPIKSADMWWLYITAQGRHIAMMHEEPDPHYLARMEDYGIKDAAIPCWSLSALLNVISKEVRLVGGSKQSYWYCERVDGNIWESADNPIDACYNLILKLDKLRIL